jgi:hypothetical protein
MPKFYINRREDHWKQFVSIETHSAVVCGGAGVQAGFRGVLVGLLEARLRPDAHLLSFQARALESFARFLELAPDLVHPLMDKVRALPTRVTPLMLPLPRFPHPTLGVLCPRP